MENSLENYVILKKDELGYYIEYAFKNGAPHDNRCLDWYSSYQEKACIRNHKVDGVSDTELKEYLQYRQKKIDQRVGKIFRLGSFTCGGEENPEEQIERHKESWLRTNGDLEGFIPENYVCKVGCPANECKKLQCKNWTYTEPVKCACWYLEGPIEF